MSRRIVLGLSGGIDSALTLAVSALAFTAMTRRGRSGDTGA